MSLYMPARVVYAEMKQQELRRIYGVKIGTHIKFPNPDKGPYIFRKDHFDKLDADTVATIEKLGTLVLEAEQQQKQSVFKRLSKAARRMLK
jgi:hypothetical protein